MFKRILVPLDGSERSEQALPIAARIAHVSGGSVLLLRVVSTLSEYGMYTTEPMLLLEEMLHEDLKRATIYLAQHAASSTLAGINTRIAVFSGLAASQILDTAQAEQIDLIVMSSHGLLGIKRWMLGSVTEKVAWHSAIPVLIVPESSHKLASLSRTVGHPLRALVALDGSAFTEAIVMPAAQLVAACSAPGRGQLHLAHLVKRPSTEEVMAYERLGLDIDLVQAALHEASDYLQAISESTSRQLATGLAVDITWSVEQCEDVADTLLKIAGDDLIALTTHGHGGIARWIKGSVARRILSRAAMPLLITHPYKNTASLTPLTNKAE